MYNAHYTHRYTHYTRISFISYGDFLFMRFIPFYTGLALSLRILPIEGSRRPLIGLPSDVTFSCISIRMPTMLSVVRPQFTERGSIARVCLSPDLKNLHLLSKRLACLGIIEAQLRAPLKSLNTIVL